MVVQAVQVLDQKLGLNDRVLRLVYLLPKQAMGKATRVVLVSSLVGWFDMVIRLGLSSKHY